MQKWTLTDENNKNCKLESEYRNCKLYKLIFGNIGKNYKFINYV